MSGELGKVIFLNIYTTKYTDGEEQKMFQTKRMNKITEDELLKLYKEVR